MQNQPAIFETHKIRRVYDEKNETWWFSAVEIIRVLTQQPDYQAARNYWKVLKNRLAKEGSQSVTNCNRLKLPAADGKITLLTWLLPQFIQLFTFPASPMCRQTREGKQACPGVSRDMIRRVLREQQNAGAI
ncbi:MAG: hypothetical protein PHY09_14970 [Desulfuromonadaceae bacterium]|nr:hypothetical protein [Desulfuromonadaceae bacterium]MDD5106564.1 hypothetical protein [Desulfuromonadaceae bacterium]